MVSDEAPHASAVNAWMAGAGQSPSADRLLERCQGVFAALWARAEVTLGDVTLGAIVDRVLHNTRERHPLLAPVRLEGNALRCDELRRRSAELDAAEVAAAVRFFLVELLSVLGNLTAEILTPALHAVLAQATPGEADDPASKEPTS